MQGDAGGKERVKEMVRLLPQMGFDPAKAGGDEDHRTCSICLEEYETGDEITILPCFHRFHTHCVASWLLADNMAGCAVCRRSPFEGLIEGGVPGQPG